MNEILSNISSALWWFGVVFVGVTVSLIASYIKPRLDIWLAKFSKAKKEKNERLQKEWADKVARLQSDEFYRVFFASKIAHENSKGAFMMMASAILFLMIGAFSLILQVPSVLGAENESAITDLLISLPQEKIILGIKLLLSFFASISLLLGVAFFNSSEKLQRQFEDSVEDMTNKQKQVDA